MKLSGRKTIALHVNFILGFFVLLAATPAFPFAAPGELDPAFGTAGKVLTEFGQYSRAGDAALQADGKIVVAGYGGDGWALVRYNADGSLDATFGTAGKVPIPSYGVAGVALQPDGRIVTVGDICLPVKGCDFGVVRFMANGSVDTSFGNNGKVAVDMGNADFPTDAAVQSDGKIVVTGGSGDAQTRNFAFATARINPDGSLDTSFDGDGRVITSLGTFSDFGASSIALQTDGKIVVAGQSGTGNYATADFAVVRYNPNGSLDASFDGDGKVFTAVSNTYDAAYGVVIQPDGKIIASGSIGLVAIALVRYNVNGSLDTSFDSDGVASMQVGYGADSVALQTNGKIVVGGGGGGSGGNDFLLARFNTNGSVDASFGSAGIVTTNFGNEGSAGAEAIAIQSDGKIVAAGSYGLDGEFSKIALARYTGDFATPNRTLYDFDGDGRSDISVARPSNAVWYIQNSNGTPSHTLAQFGFGSDALTPADYDGDGKTDIAVFRASTGTWYWQKSSTGDVTERQFGTTGDRPVPADYDGDGKADTAIFRPSTGTWWIRASADGQLRVVQFGIAEDIPTIGDFDGDGKGDIAVYRGSTGVWYGLNSGNGAFFAVRFGSAGDKPVAADYDGDGRSDIGVFRPSTGAWYILNSSTGAVAILAFGTNGDMPVAGDYDGDGKTDVAVFRPSTGTWYMMRTTAGFAAQQFGISEDRPIPAAYIP